MTNAHMSHDQHERRLVTVPSHPAYEVCPKEQAIYHRMRSGDLRKLTPRPDGRGYLAVQLYLAGVPTEFRLHRLVYQAVHGAIPEGKMVLHRNDRRRDNDPSNLYAGTAKDNARDARVNGRLNPARGERQAGAKLDHGKVAVVRVLAALGMRQVDIANRLGVGRTTVGKVIRGESWRHVA